ncbi:TonB-dependent siderophore receptor [Comamonas sp. GB3 AK4-5]|uniref:TonB-dependent siderophore receptor n=1 Tax=Comamonas sp. GB3 AK4-5 TaxID=3231487 RepID=UPI00351E93DD
MADLLAQAHSAHFSSSSTAPAWAVHRLVLALAAAGLCASAAAQVAAENAAPAPSAAAADALRDYRIPAGPLDEALNRFGRASGLLLSFTQEQVQGLRSPGLEGRHTQAKGIAALLHNTGLQALRRPDGSYMLQPVAEVHVPVDYSLREVRVAAQRLGETEGTGSYTSDAITVGKTAQAMREMPQSVAVMTRQRLDDQNITDLGKAAEQAVGMTVTDNNYRLPNIYSRGFQINSIQLDGGAPMDTGLYANVAYDLAEYDRIELLRGAAGLLNGTGNPGGAVNLVRKMPTATPQFSFTASAGSWNNYRTEFDASGPLAFDGKLRGRAVIAYENRKYFTDRRSSEKPFFYGVLEADLGPTATLALGMREQRLHENGNGAGLPRYSTGADLGLPRHTSLTTDWAYMDGYSKEAFAKLTWRVAPQWTLRANATRARQHGMTKAAFGAVAVDPLTAQGTRWLGIPTEYWNRQNLLDVNLSGAFKLLGRTHELLVGADMQDISSRQYDYGYSTNPIGRPLDVFNPGNTPWPEPVMNADPLRSYGPYGQKQYGLYGTLRMELAEGTKLIAGARLNRYKYSAAYRERDVSGAWGAQESTGYSEPTKAVPFAGLVHDLNGQWTAYASYAEIFKPQAEYKAGPAPGTGLEPMHGSTTELGIKGELLDGKLNTAFALYRTEQNDQAVLDPHYPLQGITWRSGQCCYVSSGKTVSQGFDMEISGEVVGGVNLYAGYTYNHNRNKATDAPFSSITPRHLLKLWGTWQLPDQASQWKLGGGANIQSKQYVTGTAATWNATTGKFDGPTVPFKYTQGGYAVWNLMAEYRLDPRWALTFHVNNLLDKTYYRTMGTSVSGNYYGEPRNMAVILRGKF